MLITNLTAINTILSLKYSLLILIIRMLTFTLWANSADKLIIFHFSENIDFDITCKLSPKETTCMKCQSLFSGRNMEKNYFKMSSAEVFIYPPCRALSLKMPRKPASENVVSLSSAEYSCKLFQTYFCIQANSVDPDQTVPGGTV